MTNEQAKEILFQMAKGFDPRTGEEFPPEHICNRPEVIRALFAGIHALSNSSVAAAQRKPEREPAGSEYGDGMLRDVEFLYQSGASIEEIAKAMGRSKQYIRKQLIYRGLIPSEKPYKTPTPALIPPERTVKPLTPGCVPSEQPSEVPTPAPVPPERTAKPPTPALVLPESTNKNPKPGLERAGLRWTRVEDLILEKLYDQRLPIEEIAEQMRRSRYSIYCRMERLELYADGCGYPTMDELPKWRNSDEKMLCQLSDAGKSIKEIAAAMGRAEEVIRARLFYMGRCKESPVHLPLSSRFKR